MEIQLDNLCKTHSDHPVFARLNHTFPDGRVSCILGPSGCGKTTLLRLIAGLELPDSGKVRGTAGAKISMVFQEDRLFPNLTAERNVLLTARPGFAREGARELLVELGLEARNVPVCEYSGGMRRRVAIARSLAADFDLLLLDEPFSGLDDEARRQAIAVIRKHSVGRTVLCATHGMEDSRFLDAEILQLTPLSK